MENGYFGHTKGKYNEEFEEYLNTDPYYFMVENNKIVDCAVGWDDMADSEESKEESIRLKREFMGKDVALIEQILGKEYTSPCSEEIFAKAKEIEMQRFNLSSEQEYQKFVNNTLENTDTDVKIEFFELDKTKYSCEMGPENPTYGTWGEFIRDVTYKMELVNAKIDDKIINVLYTENGFTYVDGSDERYARKERIYDFTIGDNKYTANLNIGGFSGAENLYFSRYKLLEAKDLKELLNKPDLSREDLIILEFNLQARQRMDESLQDFTSFEDLQARIYQNPEKLKENVEEMFYLMQKANISAKQDSKNNKTLHNLTNIMNNLRNTDNHEFNMQFKDCVKEIVMRYQSKNPNTGRKYWATSFAHIRDTLDEIEPLSKMRYSLPKYLKRVRNKLKEKFKSQKTENLSNPQKSVAHHTKSIDGGR